LVADETEAADGAAVARDGFWRGAWRMLCLAIPALFGGLSLAGFHFTAVQLELRLLGLVGLWGAIDLVRQLVGGWWLPRMSPISHSRLPRLGKGASSQSSAATSDNEALPVAESHLVQWQDLLWMASMGAFTLGCWAICRQLLPALRILEAVELWPHPFRILDTAADEPTAGLMTLAGLCVAVVIAGVTWFCERTLPELLDVLVLSRTRLDPGARYAVATVCRYGVLMLGTLATFQQLGIGWAQLNWLVAAMTVGLGFGLQEIFANFISGLILLIERPVRIGDIVSIGDVTGSVTRIRMRATTITDGDLRELIVPNKELITGRVINWTLTNTLSRLTIKVRAAVGTDPDLARALLLGVAQKHRLVLKQPAPSAQFEEFAENSLVFSLRVCVGTCDVVSAVRHELLTMIKREFQEAGIVTSVQPAKTGTFSVPVAGTPATAQGPPPTPLVESARSIESVPKPHFPPGDAVIAEVRTTAPQ
jgi:potassium efflux system protein